jgi:hypothetical protein
MYAHTTPYLFVVSLILRVLSIFGMFFLFTPQRRRYAIIMKAKKRLYAKKKVVQF